MVKLKLLLEALLLLFTIFSLSLVSVYKWTVISLFVFFWLAFGLVQVIAFALVVSSVCLLEFIFVPQEKLMKSLKFPFPFFVTLIHQTVLSVGSYLLMRFQKDDFSSKLDDNKRLVG